jgi:signal transduction histidine kinase
MKQVISPTDFIKLTFSKAKSLLSYELPSYLPFSKSTFGIQFSTLDQFIFSFDYIYEFDESPLVKHYILEKKYDSGRIQVQVKHTFNEKTFSYELVGFCKNISNQCIPASKLIEVVINEVRNPIVGLLATSDLYLNYGKEFELDHVEYFGITRDYAYKLSRFIDQMIYLLKLDNNEITYSDSPIHLKTILNNFQKAHLATKSTIQIDYENDVDNQVFCLGNEELIQLAVKNILLNAIQYGKSNRTVNVSTVSTSGFVGISVTDFGYGIEPQNALSIFENFKRLKLENQKNNPDGLGVGLGLVREIMNHQKGKLIIKSNSTIGCNVILYFPVLTLPVTESAI